MERRMALRRERGKKGAFHFEGMADLLDNRNTTNYGKLYVDSRWTATLSILPFGPGTLGSTIMIVLHCP